MAKTLDQVLNGTLKVEVIDEERLRKPQVSMGVVMQINKQGVTVFPVGEKIEHYKAAVKNGGSWCLYGAPLGQSTEVAASLDSKEVKGVQYSKLTRKIRQRLENAAFTSDKMKQRHFSRFFVRKSGKVAKDENVKTSEMKIISYTKFKAAYPDVFGETTAWGELDKAQGAIEKFNNGKQLFEQMHRKWPGIPKSAQKIIVNLAKGKIGDNWDQWFANVKTLRDLRAEKEAKNTSKGNWNLKKVMEEFVEAVRLTNIDTLREYCRDFVQQICSTFMIITGDQETIPKCDEILSTDKSSKNMVNIEKLNEVVASYIPKYISKGVWEGSLKGVLQNCVNTLEEMFALKKSTQDFENALGTVAAAAQSAAKAKAKAQKSLSEAKTTIESLLNGASEGMKTSIDNILEKARELIAQGEYDQAENTIAEAKAAAAKVQADNIQAEADADASKSGEGSEGGFGDISVDM